MVNIYFDGAAIGSRPGAGPDLASLAGADNLDSFNHLMGCSCAFRCVNTVTDTPTTIPLWNGNISTGTDDTGIWTLECDPIPNSLAAIATWSMPPIFLQMVAGATTGDYVGITYASTTGIFTIDWNVAAGTTVIVDTFEFYAIVFTPFSHSSHEDQVKVLGGND